MKFAVIGIIILLVWLGGARYIYHARSWRALLPTMNVRAALGLSGAAIVLAAALAALLTL